ncbi:type II secretion system F family protein [Candidatus Saccharibacteria bacterium]|nr:type II secretion system F family protein [Candidatus Saccharibacteria bacterium]HOR23448.1 type II secretion system F family protein [Candidatus Saccharibacteria bacterium]HPW47824.1 type II secretion system F family protein [Candidatus Saccharibacteria bacterium]
MPKFEYTALSKEGKKATGTTEASSKESLEESLKHQGLHPLVIKQASGLKLNFNLTKGKVKLKDLVIFTRQLSTMVSAGVPLNRSLATLEEQVSDKYFKSVINGISKDVEGGTTLAEAFAKYPSVFSDIYINMVRSGETGGILDDILKRLATQIEKEASMRKKIKSASMYPIVIGSITVVAFFGIMIFIMPKIATMIKDLGGPNAKLPFYSVIMISVSEFVQKYAIYIIISLVVSIFLTRKYVKTPKGKYNYHKLLLKIPLLKEVITKIAIARFSRTFASLMSAGVGVLESLEVTGGAIGNRVIEAELREAAKEVKNGKQLSETIEKSKYFPAIVSQMLAVGEETGKVDTILVKVADFYEEEVDTLIDGLSALIEPLMIIALGTAVGMIAASVMGPIASLSKNIGNN